MSLILIDGTMITARKEIMKIKSIKKIGTRPVYDLTIDEVNHYVLENGVVTHNTGVIYSSNQIFIISKSQEKDGDQLTGYKFTINIEKSRFVREKSKFPFTVKYNQGVIKYSGLFDIAIEGNFIVKTKKGWFALVNQETGELSEKSYREKEIIASSEIWNKLLTDDKFKAYIKSRYSLDAPVLGESDKENFIDDFSLDDEIE